MALGSNAYSNFLASGQRASDPFFPAYPAEGPTFLDDNACLCALRSTPDSLDSYAWRCIGNHSTDIYVGNSGKWFGAANAQPGGQNVTQLPMYDDSDKPNVDQVLVAQQGHVDGDNATVPDPAPLVPSNAPNANSLNVYDSACSGRNSSDYSTAYYKTSDELNASQVPVDGAPCYRLGALPVQIVNVTEWQQNNTCAPGIVDSH